MANTTGFTLAGTGHQVKQARSIQKCLVAQEVVLVKMQKSLCPQCSNTFTSREALCFDWKDPRESFGCPHCGTFYEKDLRPVSGQSLISGIFAGGIFVPGFFMATRYFKNGDVEFLVSGSLIVISCLAIYGLQILSLRKNALPTKRVDG